MELCKTLVSGKYSLLCLNDADQIDNNEDFLWAKDQLIKSFEELLPEKSCYEK